MTNTNQRFMALAMAVVMTLSASFVAHAQDSGFVEYKLLKKGSKRSGIFIQGSWTVNPGKTVTVKVPKMGNLFFKLSDVDFHKAKPFDTQFKQRLNKGKSAKSAQLVFEAASWALKHGMLNEFHAAVDEVLKLDPKHEDALRIKRLKLDMDREISDSPEIEKHLREFGPKKAMEIAKSKHFMLLHDTPKTPPPGRGKKPRAQARLELLEQVYESFLFTFFSRGIELEIPKQRMEVVLFDQYNDYTAFSTRLEPSLISAAGFYLPETNVSVFYDHSSDEDTKDLAKMAADIRKENAQAKNGQLTQMANTLDLLGILEQESLDITVVSHEATHQMAANTGLFPRHVRVPRWVHEGLAAYFECPNDATWSGIGAVNQMRIDYYRALEPDREHSNIDFIVSDQVFDFAASHSSVLHAYGQSWAFTHFMVEKHLPECMKYYRQLGEMPTDVDLSPDILVAVFDQAFGGDESARTSLDVEWRAYMRSLKTDLEIATGE